jgi:FrmR/RcnR family transcriptional regulator, repressor of rcnA expression
MSHTTRDKQKLSNRIRRIIGQLQSIEKALDEERDCAYVLQTIAASRGGIDSLMAEILEGHIRFMMSAEFRTPRRRTESTEELVDLVRAYVK